MKQIISALLIFFSLTCFSQEDFFPEKIDITNSYGLILKTYPLRWFWGSTPLSGEYGLCLERKMNSRSSVQGSLAYSGKGLIMMSVEDLVTDPGDPKITFSGYRAEFSYRLYLNKNDKLTGFYISPNLSYCMTRYSTKQARQQGSYIQAQHLDFSGVAGWQAVFDNLSFEVFTGLTYRQRHWSEKYTQTSFAISEEDIRDMYFINSPVRLKLGISIGYVF